MNQRKILVLCGHPHLESLCGGLATAYAEGAKAAGHEVRTIFISEMRFDPVLHEGFGRVQALEPDLIQFQEDLRWAEHFVMVFPLWWGSMPSVLKGLIDRSFLPGFAFKYKEGSPFPAKLLAGRTAEVIVTMDSPGFWYKWVLGAPLTKNLKRQVLGFCGIKTTKFRPVGPVRGSSPEKRKAWLEKARQWAR